MVATAWASIVADSSLGCVVLAEFLFVKDGEISEILGLYDVFVFSDWRAWTSTPGWLRL